MNNKLKLDHLIIASPDLEELANDFYKLTGVKPAVGGSHEGRGTANQLIGLDGGAYIELIGPDINQEEPAEVRPLKVDEVKETTLVGWAVQVDNIDRKVKKSREKGYDPGDVRSMTRETPEGEVLKWNLTPLSGGLDGSVPFLIDWKDTKHPSEGLTSISLKTFTITHPNPEEVQKALKAMDCLDLVSDIRQGEVKLEIELDTPKGRVKIT